MKKLISRRNFLAAMGTMAAAGVLTACGGSSSGTASSAAASSTAASAAESWGDVKLTMWGAEEDQTMLREMADAFIEQNADKGNVTIEIGVQSESSAKDTVLADPETSCQGLFNQIHRKATKKVPGSTFMLLTLRQVGHLRPLNSSSQRHAYSGNWSI